MSSNISKPVRKALGCESCLIFLNLLSMLVLLGLSGHDWALLCLTVLCWALPGLIQPYSTAKNSTNIHMSTFLHEWKLKCPNPDKIFLFYLCWLCGCSANLIMTSQVCWRHRRHPPSTALSAWSHGNHLHDMDMDMMFGRYLTVAWVWVLIIVFVHIFYCIRAKGLPIIWILNTLINISRSHRCAFLNKPSFLFYSSGRRHIYRLFPAESHVKIDIWIT